MQDHLYTVLKKLIVKNNIRINQDELKFQLQSHPSYPSLHAVTGVLDHFNVENVALMVPVNRKTVTQLPAHFLAQIKTDTGEEFVLVSRKGDAFELLGGAKARKNMGVLKFLELFTGVLVAVEKDTTIIEQTSKEKTNLQLPLTIGTLICFLISFFFIDVHLGDLLSLIFSFIGVYISYSIKRQEEGKTSFLGDAFCSGEKKTSTSCNDVLTSMGATIYKSLKLSDLSLLYFTGFSLMAYVLIVFEENLSIAYWLSLFAFPITIYSIYYQAFVVKKWCMLCLGVVGVLWLQTGVMTTFNSLDIPTSKSNLVFIFSFLLVGTLWSILSSILESWKDLKEIKIQYFKFKRNFNLFNTLLQSSNHIATQLDGFQTELIFGNKNAPLKIVVVTSPFCGYCKKVHTLVEDILKKYRDNVAITIRFNISEITEENRLLKIATKLVDLYTTKGQNEALKAMHDIYDDPSTKTWLNKWGKNTSVYTYEETFKKINEWCTTHNINFTPEILISGKSYPKEYDRNDLIYFMEDLIEHTTNASVIKTTLETA